MPVPKTPSLLVRCRPLVILALLGVVGCGGSGDGTGGDAGSADGGAPDAGPPRKIDKVDVVFVVDNSRSMTDKQIVLAGSAGALVGRLANPLCVDGTGAPAATQPAGPADACPAMTAREFPPVTDMHVGVISSSLGGHASDACAATETTSCAGGATNTSQDDRGHLLTRQDPCSGGQVPTYQNLGFLAWDPDGKLSPPGESQVGGGGAPGLVPSLQDIIMGAGQLGCGYEAPLEAWYRFLVDPTPYGSLTLVGGSATRQGTDDTLLAQRAAFLRPDSLLLVVMLTDEDDCSIKEFGQYYFAAQQRNPGNPGQSFYLPHARAECATNPSDPCCASCGQATPAGCPADPGCAASPSHDNVTDDPNLRCFDQKRRFGIDFLYPTDRYIAGLTAAMVPDVDGNLVQNPLFAPGGGGTAGRDPDMIFFASWAGVPWQDIARDPADATKGWKDDGELAATTTGGITTWDAILGDPANAVAPLDPHMVASPEPRVGTDPLTNIMLAPPSAPNGTDPINGHEYAAGSQPQTLGVRNDLQYACVFPLHDYASGAISATPTARDCSAPGVVGCSCGYQTNDLPICEPDPSAGGNRTLQTQAKVYPGVRPLAVVKGLGAQGVVGSIAPPQLTDPARGDYAYGPNARAIIERVGPLLAR